jgi:protein-L-isoaspartate(D-aspartate) O-methyltransferase
LDWNRYLLPAIAVYHRKHPTTDRRIRHATDPDFMSSRDSGIGMTSQRTRLRMVERLRGQGIKDEHVLRVFAQIQRHLFVDEALAHRAYENTALPIGFGQTISQPWVVARMLELAGVASGVERVLEVGTGCGYQAALLSRLVRQVYSIERIPQLLAQARRNLHQHAITNVRLKHADGHIGWKESAPFGAIVMSAATAHVPEALLEQLAEGARLVMPLGDRVQHLTVVTREADRFHRRTLDEVRFVPLIAGAGI